MTPEPKDKLDAATTVVVNGPEDAPLGWRQIDWRRGEDERTAVAAADLHGIAGGGPEKGPQPAEVDAPLAREHAGERAAGDGAQRRSYDGGRGRRGGADSRGQAELADRVQQQAEPFKAHAGQAGVHPEAGQQREAAPARYSRDRSTACIRHGSSNALEPEWEARFEPRSYGFRPGRGCHDAIEAIFQAGKGRARSGRWVLDADLAAAFDRIGHDHLLASSARSPPGN